MLCGTATILLIMKRVYQDSGKTTEERDHTMTSKLKLQDKRNYFKPFHYPWAYDLWLKHEQSHWLHTEVPMIEDIKDWKNNLSTEEKYFLTNICLGIPSS